MNAARAIFAVVACSIATTAPACSSSSAGAGGDAGVTPGPLVLATDNGNVQGVLGDGARAFLGIPYAAPPVGDLRWKPPAQAQAWSQTRDASSYGADCPQYDLQTGKPTGALTEDCLFVNVWTPLAAPSKPLPIMVYIHGGGFVLGSGSGATYNGSTMASTGNVIVVTLNYRLGPFGFLEHTALAAEAGKPAAPPYGLLDQRAALQWVKRNAAAFGGNPDDVTIFGESAGGASVCAQLAMPVSRGLFHRAIVESGPCQAAGFFTAQKGLAQGDDLAKAVGCTDATTAAACLRGKSASDIAGALQVRKVLFGSEGVSWGPVFDGVELPQAPLDAFAAGNAAPGVPVILGTNRDEGNLFTHIWSLAFGHDITTDEMKASLATLYTADQIATILGRYPLASYPNTSAQASALLTDSLFTCATRRTARALSAHGTPTYLYQFTATLNMPLLAGIGAAHSVELPFVFGTTLGGKNIGDDEKPLSNTIIGYWTRFGAAGDPNGGGATTWPRYDQAGDAHLVLDASITAGSALKKDVCDFWDTLP